MSAMVGVSGVVAVGVAVVLGFLMLVEHSQLRCWWC